MAARFDLTLMILARVAPASPVLLMEWTGSLPRRSQRCTGGCFRVERVMRR